MPVRGLSLAVLLLCAAPAVAADLYYCKCDTGAQADCASGADANPGTIESPKQTLTVAAVNAAAAGDRFFLCRGGAWDAWSLSQIENPNATETSPLVVDAYGVGPVPLLKGTTGAAMLELGKWNSVLDDGGYTFRNLKLDGQGVTDWGLWLRDNLRALTVENVEITGFLIGIHAQSGTPHGVHGVTFRDCHVHHNSAMGLLGKANDFVIEGCTFAANNFSGSGFNHAIYLSGGTNVVVRDSTFTDNSTVGGVCTGGNITTHGQIDGVLFENNVITQAAATGGCYGFSITTGYDTAEYFRNFVLRGNTVVNVGNCGICVGSAPGVVVENNVIVNLQPGWHGGIVIPTGEPGAGDEADTGAIVRNNTVYLGNGSVGTGVVSRVGTGLQVVSNLVVFGADAGANGECFGHAALSSYAAFDHNLCFHAGGSGAWSATYANLGAAQAAGFDPNGSGADPLLVAPPAAANDWSARVQFGSPAVDHGHATLSSATDRDGTTRPQGAGYDIGAYELVIECASGADCTAPPACRTATGATCASGACVYPAAAAGSACDDGEACSALDTCDGQGACLPGADVCDGGLPPGDGGAAGTDGAAAGDGGSPPDPSPTESSCGCRATPAASVAGWLAAALALAAVARRRRH